ncbi:uncharacterized protein LOC144344617, partial [Saccoglossus kowalevskii]
TVEDGDLFLSFSLAAALGGVCLAILVYVECLQSYGLKSLSTICIYAAGCGLYVVLGKRFDGRANELKAMLGERSEMKSKIRKLQMESKSSEEEKNALQRRVIQLQGENKQDTLQIQLNHVRDELQRTQRITSNWQRQFCEEERKVASLRQELVTLERNYDSLHRKHAQMDETKQLLEDNLLKMQDEDNKRLNELNRMRREVGLLHDEKDVLVERDRRKTEEIKETIATLWRRADDSGFGNELENSLDEWNVTEDGFLESVAKRAMCRLQQSTDEVDRLQEESEQRNSRIVELEQQECILREKLVQVNNEVSDHLETNRQLKEYCLKVNQDNAVYIAQIQNYDTIFRQKITEAVTPLQCQIDILQAEIKATQDEKSTAQKKLQNFVDENENLKSKLATTELSLATLEEHNKLKQEKFGKLQTRFESQHSEVQNMKSELFQNDAVSSIQQQEKTKKINQMEKEILQLQKKIDELKENNASVNNKLTQNVSALTELSVERDDLAKQCKEGTNKIEQLSDDIQDKEEILKKLKSLETFKLVVTSSNSCGNKLASSKNMDHDSLLAEKDNELFWGTRVYLRDKLHETEIINSSLKEELESARKEIEVQTLKVEESEGDIKDLHEKKEELNKKLCAKIKSQEIELDKKKNELCDVLRNIGNKKQELNKLTERVDFLKKELDARDMLIKKLEHKFEQAKLENEDLKSKILEEEIAPKTEKDELQTELCHAENIIKQLENYQDSDNMENNESEDAPNTPYLVQEPDKSGDKNSDNTRNNGREGEPNTPGSVTTDTAQESDKSGDKNSDNTRNNGREGEPNTPGSVTIDTAQEPDKSGDKNSDNTGNNGREGEPNTPGSVTTDTAQEPDKSGDKNSDNTEKNESKKATNTPGSVTTDIAQEPDKSGDKNSDNTENNESKGAPNTPGPVTTDTAKEPDKSGDKNSDNTENNESKGAPNTPGSVTTDTAKEPGKSGDKNSDNTERNESKGATNTPGSVTTDTAQESDKSGDKNSDNTENNESKGAPNTPGPVTTDTAKEPDKSGDKNSDNTERNESKGATNTPRSVTTDTAKEPGKSGDKNSDNTERNESKGATNTPGSVTTDTAQESDKSGDKNIDNMENNESKGATNTPGSVTTDTAQESDKSGDKNSDNTENNESKGAPNTPGPVTTDTAKEPGKSGDKNSDNTEGNESKGATNTPGSLTTDPVQGPDKFYNE